MSLKPLEDMTARFTEDIAKCRELIRQVEKVLEEVLEIKVLEGESKKAIDKAKVILEAKSLVSSSSKKPEIILSFDETKVSSIKKAVSTIVNLREKGQRHDDSIQ